MNLISLLFVVVASACSVGGNGEIFEGRSKNETLSVSETLPNATPCSSYDDEYVSETNVDYNVGSYFSKSDYFKNLYTFSPYNRAGGSCGFVSLINILTFYDTFYSDDIVPEQYDAHSNAYLTADQANMCSPGVQPFDYNPNYPLIDHSYEMDYRGSYSYYYYCHDSRSFDLESELTCIANFVNNSDSNSLRDDGKPVFEVSVGGWDYQKILNEFYGNRDFVNVVSKNHLASQQEHINFIKNSIDEGYPVMVQVCKESVDPSAPDTDHHAIVAYEYDLDNIYANFGWGEGYTHEPVIGGAIGYNKIYGSYRIELPGLSGRHTHSDNYFYGGEGHCGCNVEDVIEIINGGTASDFPPTIRWMRNPTDQNEHYYVWVRRGYDVSDHDTRWDISGRVSLTCNQVTLAPSIWDYYLYSGASQIYFVLVRVGMYGEHETAIVGLDRPIYESRKLEFQPGDWNFYMTALNRTSTGTVTRNGTTMTYKYMNCFDNGNDVLMTSTPVRTMSAQSVLECSFASDYINRLDAWLELSITRPIIGSISVDAQLQYLRENGEWKKCADLNDEDMDYIPGLKRKCYFVMSEPTKAFRFVVSCQCSRIAQFSSVNCCLKLGGLTLYLG